MRRVGALFVLLTIAGCSESSDDAFSDASGGVGSGGAAGSGGSAAGAGGSTAGSMNGGGAAGASGAAGQGGVSGSSPTGGSAGIAGSPPGGSGGAAGSGPICPDEEPPAPPVECSIVQSVLRCRYERPNPDDPSQTCSIVYRCQCVSDHMGGADCSWLAGSLECPP